MKFKLTFLTFFICVSSQVSTAQPTGYGYGKRLTIDASQVVGGSPLIDYPLMVRFDADNELRTVANGGHVENINGFDILFTSDIAGTIVLNHQIESYNPTTGGYVAWVRIPTLSNSIDTEIFMFYGNCSISIDPSTTTTWNSSYSAVYFLHDDFVDVTGNGNNATNGGSTNTSSGIIGDGQNFINTTHPGDHIQVPTASISAGQGTLSIWINAASFSTNHQYIFGHTTTPPFGNRIQLYVDDATGLLDLGIGNSHTTNINFFDLNTSEWYYVALTWNGTNYLVYVNGTVAASGTYAGLGALHTFLDIGNNGNAANRNEPWIGDLDHARLSDEVFTETWIQTEYNNQRQGSNFYSIGTEFSANRTFYSRASGDWESNNSWSFTPDGSSGTVPVGVFPRRADNVVIQSGHTILVNSVTDNGPCSQSPNDLGRANVGPFTGSEDQMFYHTGDILIANGGTLTVTEEIMLEGYTLVDNGGTFTIAEDIINLGYLEVLTTATFSNTDDLILSGNSITIINNLAIGVDDIYLDWTDATLCGEGIINLGNGGPDPDVQLFNGSTLDQICYTFDMTCTLNCDAFPINGTGNFSSGNSGPGGVGSLSSSGDVVLWLDANSINQATGTNLSIWSDLSGYGNDASSSGGNEPVFNTGQLNGFPAVQFVSTNSDFLRVAHGASLNLSTLTMFTVGNLEASSTPYASFISKIQTGVVAFNGYGLFRNDNLQGVTFSIDALGNEAQSAITYGVDAIHSSIYSDPALEHFVNEVGPSTDSYAGPVTNHTTPLYIGATVNAAGTNPDRFLAGDISEIVLFNAALNNAKRIIVNNYLSAKYNVALSNNNVYTMDNPANGDYDFEIAGIGQAADGSNHRDSRGTGIVRMWNPSNLSNNEFLLWGHDSTPLENTSTIVGVDVDGDIIEERLSRVWRVSEVGDVGTVSISFNFSQLGNPLGSNLRLLIDRNGNGFADNDVTPIAGSVSNGVAIFSNVNFQDGDRFTLGNTDASSPLPVELILFDAIAQGAEVVIRWATASEINNDFFTVERSVSAETWESISYKEGAGNSSSRIDYQEIDKFPYPGVSYYRIKQTDFDGTISYSDVKRVELDEIFLFKVFPNPTEGVFQFSSGLNLDGAEILVYNLLGQRLPAQIESERNNAHIELVDVPDGIYLLKIKRGYWQHSLRIWVRK